MNLKPKEQASILAGQYPELVRPEKDFEEGEEIVLKTTTTINGPIPEVSICILGHAKRKNGAWEAIYRVKDDRGVYAAQGLGYTRSPARALDKTAPILDPEVIEGYAAHAHLEHVERRSPSERNRQQRGMQRKLSEAMKALTPTQQVELLAKLERDIKEATKEVPNGHESKGEGQGEQRIEAGS